MQTRRAGTMKSGMKIIEKIASRQSSASMSANVLTRVITFETMLPRVSLPRVKPTSPAAVALAEPADDPLDPRSGDQGLRVRSLNHFPRRATS